MSSAPRVRSTAAGDPTLAVPEWERRWHDANAGERGAGDRQQPTEIVGEADRGMTTSSSRLGPGGSASFLRVAGGIRRFAGLGVPWLRKRFADSSIPQGYPEKGRIRCALALSMLASRAMQAPASPDLAWPVILSLIDSPKSVVDFGCGTGYWLWALRRFLPEVEVFGLNTAARSNAGQLLSDDQFRLADLTKPVVLDRRFDLAISLEVAEHLPPSAAETLVRSICLHSDTVLFSAAIPGQGAAHLNEQWPAYWIERFAVHDFQCFDRVRPLIWQNEDISIWYRQNTMLFLRSPRR